MAWKGPAAAAASLRRLHATCGSAGSCLASTNRRWAAARRWVAGQVFHGAREPPLCCCKQSSTLSIAQLCDARSREGKPVQAAWRAAAHKPHLHAPRCCCTGRGRAGAAPGQATLPPACRMWECQAELNRVQDAARHASACIRRLPPKAVGR